MGGGVTMGNYWNVTLHAGMRVWARDSVETPEGIIHSLSGPYVVKSIVTEETIGEDGELCETNTVNLSNGRGYPKECLVRDNWTDMKSAGTDLYEAAEVKEEPATDPETLAAAEVALHEPVDIAGVG